MSTLNLTSGVIQSKLSVQLSPSAQCNDKDYHLHQKPGELKSAAATTLLALTFSSI